MLWLGHREPPHKGAVPLFAPGAVPPSRPAGAEARRAQGTVKAGRRGGLRSCFGVARPCLDRTEHGATLTRPGRRGRAVHAGWDAVLTHSKTPRLFKTAQAIRASLLASAIASMLWCSRFLAASIQALRP
jgi:hypothetical protein